MFNNIPEEMRAFNQWIVWQYEEVQDGKPTKVPYSPHDSRHASVSDPSTWGTFADAINAAPSFSGIGFVLTDADPYTFIDLDEPKAHVSELDKQQAYDRQLKIYNEFVSYAERSPSGKGLHIIVKGSVERGRKRSFIEIYSNQRFMTMTGDVYRPAPIQDYNGLLNILWQQMGSSATAYVYEGDDEERDTDEEIIDRALNAANGEKFAMLLKGEWQGYYPSQSEADIAFIDIVAFYTRNRHQITRIFRNSPLGQTPKSGYSMRGLRIDYVDWMINKSFDRMLPPVDVEGLKIQLEQALATPKPENQEDCLKNRLPNLPCSGTLAPDPIVTLTQNAPLPPEDPPAPAYDVPPGLVGDIARFIYEAAPRPVPEIALAGAIGLMAGICGRSFNISGTGLNQYVLLLARTGRGKEAIANGIDKLMSAVQRTVPAAMQFIGPAEISSPQALAKYMCKTSNCFVSLVGEYGVKLQEMTAWNANTNQISLKRMLLDLFGKSGEGKVVRPTIYSDTIKNTEPILAPAFTLLGESTPGEFYKALNESMISSGLLPRFFIIEYHGKRPPLNEDHILAVPGFQLIEQLSTLCAHSLMLNTANKSVQVEMTPDALQFTKEFNLYCDRKMNGTKEENVIEELWNRAHLKVLKLAALIAVGCNPYQPTITLDVAKWAHKIIVNDVSNILGKFEAGEIGGDTEETAQIDFMFKACKEYLTKPWNEIETYKASTMKMHYDKVITASYLSRRLTATTPFKKDRIGATNAIKRTIETLKANGEIRELGPKQVTDTYNYSGKCYVISNVDALLVRR